jgi:Abortive infection alpha
MSDDPPPDLDDTPPPPPDGPEGLDALLGLARIAAFAGWHTAGWALRTSTRLSWRVAQASVSPEKAGELARDAGRTAQAVMRELRGEPPLEPCGHDRRFEVHPAEGAVDFDADGYHGRTLREEGAQLMRRSRDVHYVEDAHPAYERILSELAPDEGRILRLLLLDGPQPSVDIRTGGPIGLVRSTLIAPGLSMIGVRAGCRYVDRVPSYLNNLFRLGMVWFSRETLPEPRPYQVLEAQPDSLAAIDSVRHAKVVRRSIQLTPFGKDFCRVALTPNDHEVVDLPPHSTPPASTSAPQPPSDLPGAVGDLGGGSVEGSV